MSQKAQNHTNRHWPILYAWNFHTRVRHAHTPCRALWYICCWNNEVKKKNIYANGKKQKHKRWGVGGAKSPEIRWKRYWNSNEMFLCQLMIFIFRAYVFTHTAHRVPAVRVNNFFFEYAWRWYLRVCVCVCVDERQKNRIKQENKNL